MNEQIEYYNRFAAKYKDAILNSKNPSIWTTDIKENGPVSQSMKRRVNIQKEFILKNFTKDKPILDLGCGFGRQAWMIAKNGYPVTGVDNSNILIDIANALFKKHNLTGNFYCSSILDFHIDKKMDQIFLLDVFEHIKPNERLILLEHIAQNLCHKEAKLLITFPAVNKFNILEKVKNLLKNIMPFMKNKEHPYPIPNKKKLENFIKDLFSVLEYQIKNDTIFFLLKRKV